MSDTICKECRDILKDRVQAVCLNNPNLLITAEDINDPPNTSLHASCAIRIIAQYSILFNKSRV